MCISYDGRWPYIFQLQQGCIIPPVGGGDITTRDVIVTGVNIGGAYVGHTYDDVTYVYDDVTLLDTN